jgi:pyruvate dehydrogenase E1 component
MREEGIDRANFLLSELSDRVTKVGGRIPYSVNTPYRNTIPVEQEAVMPGDMFMERRIRSLIRWNALAMVVRANKRDGTLGGHISSFASSATLYDVGFNYFFRGPGESGENLGDLIYFQGHAAPGIYARSFLEGRLSEKRLDSFRQEVDGEGLSSYPHPWLMPDYWQFPTVSMGLGPLQAIYQAHVMKYLDSRDLVPMKDRKVWAFLGDGECDEPETLGALSLAGREKLDNLIFVVNCNLQRLDGPVRGNGKIIQELEGYFRGAGWNVLKVVWGRLWDPLFAKDDNGLMQKEMDRTVDGEFQNFKAKGGAYVRESFFNKHPDLAKLVEEMSDRDIYQLNRGGHDPFKLYAAYSSAVHHKGQPTVILAKTVKGYGMGSAGESENDTHSVKVLNVEELKHFRDRFGVPLSDQEVEAVPYYRPSEDSPEIKYIKARRGQLGGPVPIRVENNERLKLPALSMFDAQLKGSGERSISTTMSFVRLLSTLAKNKDIGDRIVPIVPDEARTFGMEGMFRQLGIYSSVGQLYEPEDSDEIGAYHESRDGQVLEEGINEAGAFSAWIATATSQSSHQYSLIPFYVFYSMFGFQRIGDLAWAAGDLQARGFLLGGTSGRTTLNGEGLQHQDGHSHLLSSSIPNCVSYDPCYAYELAVIIQDGLERMLGNKEPIYYYITLMNENYPHPAMPKGSEEGIKKGMYLLRSKGKAKKKMVRLLGSGAILREVEKAADLLLDRGISSEIWSVTSYIELARELNDVERINMLNPGVDNSASYVESCLSGDRPVIASSDYVKAVPEQLRSAITAPYHVLGTDGFGRSDTREKLRSFFEIDQYFIAFSALTKLYESGDVSLKDLSDFQKEFGIDSKKQNPRTT